MVGDLAKIVSLTSYGNLLLTDQSSSSTARLLNEHCLSGVVHSMEFLHEGAVVADYPSNWVLYLANRQAERLGMIVFKGSGELPDHIAASFSNGIASGLQITFKDHCELWVAKSVANADEGWTLALNCVPQQQPISAKGSPGLPKAAKQFSEAVKHSHDYAVEKGWGRGMIAAM